MKGNVEEIDYKSAVDFLLPRHYAGRIPTISKAFGWFESGGGGGQIGCCLYFW